MPDWTDLALGYAAYGLLLSMAVARFVRARRWAVPAITGAAVLWLVWPAGPPATPAAEVLHVVLPSLAMLGAYRLSGAFVDEPDRGLERWLLDIDDRALARTSVLRAYHEAPAAVREAFELAYLMVYAMLPLGALALVSGGRGDALGVYWRVVFAAELACYAMLPWLQSRPPRAIEAPAPGACPGPVRRLNLFVLARGSIQANTIPSGHAAGAVAIALAVGSVLPAAGLAFAVLAAAIILATVLGRYHYALDTMLGCLVGVTAWAVLG